MDIIQLLPDSVANQIAAGEVIQRPANVIKELVENSVDAGADKIDIIIVDAGRTLIQVIDNGKGMSTTDARLAFERHATSKIRKADDLFALRTMGFRGEALPSIAAVANVELETRQKGEELGTQLQISASKVLSQQPCSCSEGCNFKVENLFFNVPARRKFLKSNATELKQILTAFERIALVYPDIAFSLHSNGSEVFNLSRCNLRQRIADIYGKKQTQDMLPVDVDTTLVKIKGFVGTPEMARKKQTLQNFFVNGRFMRHPYFAKAVQTAYDRLVAQGDQPPYFIYMEVDPGEIDVNIHPTKTEIKFSDEQAIWQILSATVREAVGVFSEVPSIDFDVEGKPEIPMFGSEKPKSSKFQEFKSPKTPSVKGWETLYQQPKREELVESHLNFEPLDPLDPLKPLEPLKPLKPSETAAWQFKGQYIVSPVQSGMMLIDQHRAHLRILFEEFQKRVEEHKAVSQSLMFPEAVQLSTSESAVLEICLPELQALGFELTALGGGNYAINAVPAGLEGLNPSRLVQDMVKDVEEDNHTVKEEINNSLALTMARNAALPVGQVLSQEEMDDLVNRLFLCQNVNYTPDGRKIFIIIKSEDIISMFS